MGTNLIKFENGKVVVDLNEVRAHLRKTIPDPTEESSETGFEANDAARGLEGVRRLFYGTPIEDLISTVIGVCSTVSNHLEEAPEDEEGDDPVE